MIGAPEYQPTTSRWLEDVRAMRMAVRSGAFGLLALAQAACFNPRVPLGVPCSFDKSCPEGQACVAGICGGTADLVDAALEVDAAEAGIADRDGDGVPDAIDNCPDMPNPDQSNVDGDALGDACDPCPIDADNTDLDGDGVPGLCDPHPDTIGDKIVAFQTFHGAIPSTWQVVGTGTITATGDGAVFTDTANQTAALVAPVTAPFGNGMIMASVIVDETPGGNNVRPALTLGLPYNPATDRGILCQLHAPNPGSMTGREVSLFDSLANMEPANNQFVWATATPYRLTMIRNGTSYLCSATDGNGVVKAANGGTNSTPAQSEVAVVASGTSAHVAWVLVVSSP
jgi:hypothetical protein